MNVRFVWPVVYIHYMPARHMDALMINRHSAFFLKTFLTDIVRMDVSFVRPAV